MQDISWRFVGIGALVIAAQALALYLLGQPAICECGYVKVWESVVLSAGNSQHLADWYTFSHIIHGFVFYLGLWYFFPRMSIGMRLVLAIAIEAGWEVFENTPMIINHYREQALAQGYIGDSILNSVSDTLAMVLGFILAWRLPLWGLVALGIGMELFTGVMIRDGLILNIVGFAYTPDWIANWQNGG